MSGTLVNERYIARMFWEGEIGSGCSEFEMRPGVEGNCGGPSLVNSLISR